MRKFGFFLAGGALVFLGATLVEGQGGDKGKKGGGFGGFGGAQNPLSLLNRQEVKKELDVTDAQLEKLSPEVMVAIGKVLEPKQFKRFKEIDLQQRGNNAFKDKAVQKHLKMNEEQVKSITSLIDDSTKEILETLKGGGGKGGGEKRENIRKEAKEKIMTVLTKEQRSSWREMIGEEFKFQQQGFGFGGKGKDDPKKTDPKKKDAE